MRRETQTLGKISYIALVMIFGLAAYLRPRQNFDMVPYMGSAVASTAEATQKTVYDDLRASVPPESYKDLTSGTPYEADCFSNPYHFAEVLPFYSVKPLYVLGIGVFHRLGFSLSKSTVLVSIVSFFALALLLWRWIGWPAFLLIITIPVAPLIRMSTPDALNLALVMWSLSLIINNRTLAGTILLLLAIWSRPDTTILAGTVFLALLLLRRIRLADFAVFSTLALGSYWAINHFAGNYGWAVLIHNSLFGPITSPGEIVLKVSRPLYLSIAASGLRYLEHGETMIFVGIALLAWRFHESKVYRSLIAACLGAVVLHYLGFPLLDMRYFAPMYLFFLVAGITAFQTHLRAERAGR
jgi:hypothetical protein